MTSTKDDKLLFLPLGGAGEIGMNLNLYGWGQEDNAQWMMVDLGVTFADPGMPAVDIIMPDPAFIEEYRDDLIALVLTHAHEDHLGAVPYLWPRLKCPIYATPFTASVLKRKLREVSWGKDVPIHVIELGGTFSVGPFDLELVSLTHSIPEPNALAITTPYGMVLHTGDWKFDPDPVVGDAADIDRLRELGDAKVLAMVCDSTNVFSPGDSGSEGDLQESLTRIIASCKNRVAVSCFSSNIARLKTVAEAAHNNERDVVISGRSMRNMIEAARETGYIPEDMVFLYEEDAGYLPRDKMLLICTGSQGETRAALSRIASGDHPRVSLDEGDTVIFSSRVIPGNEVSISQLQNTLSKRGIKIIDWQDDFVHVSGHPARDELTQMYQLVRPQIAIPVHGEARHMIEHAALAHECQVKTTVVPQNGSMISITKTGAEIIDLVPSGRLALEGKRLVPIDGKLIRNRRKALYSGFVVATVVIDGNAELFDEPQITDTGLLDEDEIELENAIIDAIANALENLPKKDRRDDDAITSAIRIAMRRFYKKEFDKKPVTHIHLVRV